ncbi:uncharacterized protein SCHCODRAFT_02495414 [Schizophyllum commune H4-8]|nr:uncharacterized protein SCHCODRAFT_02495414 [Schizophyllum commune H4-8]KAI5895073.1 hypothetical protein SCHCODRAFT_02495414 [Schizophyllum commune H4-8]
MTYQPSPTASSKQLKDISAELGKLRAAEVDQPKLPRVPSSRDSMYYYARDFHSQTSKMDRSSDGLEIID